MEVVEVGEAVEGEHVVKVFGVVAEEEEEVVVLKSRRPSMGTRTFPVLVREVLESDFVTGKLCLTLFGLM